MAYYQSNYPPMNPYGGGYTSYAYGNQFQNPYQNPYQMQHMHHMPMPPMPPMGTMPPSHITNVVVQNQWTCNGAFMNAAAEVLGEEMLEVEEEEEEEEEEFEEEEELQEEVKKKRKNNRKKAKKQKKVEELLAKKAAEDEEFMQKVKMNYISKLKSHLDMDGTLEPTEGTVKGIDRYPADDPVCAWVLEFDGDDSLPGKKWDPERDCTFLDQAMDGAGTNEGAIIHCVATRCNAQRQKLKKIFLTAYGRDLIENLDSELSGDFREAILSLFVPPAEYDAYCIKEAIYGPGTDESVLIEIFGSRTPCQIQAIRDSYVNVASPNRKEAETLIEQDIEDDTSGDFKRFLISASQGGRRELDPEVLDEAVEAVEFEGRPTGQFKINMEKLVDVDKAKRDAKKLYEATEDQFGTDEDEMIRIFAVPEVYQSRATYDEYVKLSQRDPENTIDRETSGDFGKGLLTLVKCLKCRPKYFAERLQWCMKGLGTHDADLIRVIVSRSEIDMVQIKECFLELTDQTLWNWLEYDCSGDYKKVLQAIVGKN